MNHYLRSFSLRTALLTTLAVSALSGATAWAAQSDVETHSVSVRLGDIDLSAPAGLAIAQKRISIAATSACDALHPSGLAAVGWFETCRREVISVARNDLDLRLSA